MGIHFFSSQKIYHHHQLIKIQFIESVHNFISILCITLPSARVSYRAWHRAGPTSAGVGRVLTSPVRSANIPSSTIAGNSKSRPLAREQTQPAVNKMRRSKKSRWIKRMLSSNSYMINHKWNNHVQKREQQSNLTAIVGKPIYTG